ncbi:alpha-ketoglutarate-dependent dioxygenase AlkB [Croceicoccus sp. F390]|uniref:Alpha-ketoglutarate-dependent dioxygenase AlkB n=1 Tax=Croceicoccus esteveae TaxID=3075597 RepID=A0ABU2ZER8_9SPHN|nr:alpha-ketoglutarate-dependent dioxygenase AlkB [Croceicoccus sp. F390]MDT0575093.1 alpha-ketoglutarate-dependent dioxygenase AlkB [Croceicoccus sp. F390]
MATQHDLFGNMPQSAPVLAAAPDGLTLCGRIVGDSAARDITGLIDTCGLAPFRYGQWAGKRLTRSFGWHYDFAGGGLRKEEQMPVWLVDLRMCVANAFDEEASRFEQALLIRYDPGAGIGWHRDRPVFDTILGVSFGASAELRLRRRKTCGFDRATVKLDAGRAYRLKGPARELWEHSILPQTDTRWSISFRSLRDGAPPVR